MSNSRVSLTQYEKDQRGQMIVRKFPTFILNHTLSLCEKYVKITSINIKLHYAPFSHAWWIKILDLGEFVVEFQPIVNQPGHLITTISIIKISSHRGHLIIIIIHRIIIKIANHLDHLITISIIKTASHQTITTLTIKTRE